ncbi:MAG: tetratricopeptide repeat protein [Alistipes sp.]|nr:tetratricopeptide repeat protein [Alistipes sp.]MBQ3187783.1 tetratricopeptide repeat protein [Alistipes sp.]
MQRPQLNPTPDQTFELVGTGPYDFRKILDEAARLQHEGQVERACNHRFQAFQRLMELLPDDEEVILEWNHRNSRAVLELLHATAVDHFLIGDYELSAAQLELLMELDPEDHLEAATLLAFDYQAMDEQELFDEVINDVSDKHADRVILLLWAGFRREGRLPAGELKRLQERFPAYYREFTATAHPADEAYLQSIESEHPSVEAEARELWFRTESLWSRWPAFIEQLKATL